MYRHMEIPEGDTSIYELVNGTIVKRASPHSIHQIVVSNIHFLLRQYIDPRALGRVLVAPLDVYFEEENVPHTDVFFIKKDREKIIELNGPVWGSPDLIVEVISEGTAKNDRFFKKNLYEKFNVQEYWIADPPSKSVEIYTLVDGSYKLLDIVEIDGILKSQLIDGFEVNVKDIFK